MLEDKLDIYLDKFENRIINEPPWPSHSTCVGYINLLEREVTGIYTLNRTIQAAINNFAFSIAKSYTPEMAQVKGIGPSSAIFDKAKVFPIHTLEWLFATLEIATHYRKELGWVSNCMANKGIRIMRKKYGTQFTHRIENIIEETYRIKNLDWNRTIYELLSDMYEYGPKYGIKILEEIVWSIAKKSWATRDSVEIEEIIENIYNNKLYTKKTTLGIAFFSIASNIGAKAKQNSHI